MWSVSSGIVAYDADWQRPAITEEHAYRQLLNSSVGDSSLFLYLAFPWANLIDGINRDAPVGRRLRPAIAALPPIRGYRHVATVCQHIRFKEWLGVFNEKGITDVFAAHAEKGCSRREGVRIHPFPLYPVNYPVPVSRVSVKEFSARRYLCSFVGAFNPNHYLTSARAAIAELGDRGDSVIRVGREWHYEQAVYGRQIHDKSASEEEYRRERDRESEYADLLRQTRFSLCPSGTGPNSIRLWESIEAGCIPVLISDRLALPGSKEIWKEACVVVSEDRESILRIPELISKVEADKWAIQRKLEAVEYLRQRYGRGNFIEDIKTLAGYGIERGGWRRATKKGGVGEAVHL